MVIKRAPKQIRLDRNHDEYIAIVVTSAVAFEKRFPLLCQFANYRIVRRCNRLFGSVPVQQNTAGKRFS